MSASAAALLTAGGERAAGARNDGEHDFSRARPRTSTGCESRARNKIGVDLVAKKWGDRRGKKEVRTRLKGFQSQAYPEPICFKDNLPESFPSKPTIR